MIKSATEFTNKEVTSFKVYLLNGFNRYTLMHFWVVKSVSFTTAIKLFGLLAITW